MPFNDLPEGQTHSFNDGCGCPEHNDMSIKKKLNDCEFVINIIKKFDEWRNDGEHCSLDDKELYYLDVVMLKDFIRTEFTAMIDEIEKEIMNNGNFADGENYQVISLDKVKEILRKML